MLNLYVNEKVIVRCDRSGVFYGVLLERDGSEAKIGDVRNIHWWEGAATLTELSNSGSKLPNECRITAPIPELLVIDVIEILPVSEVAQKSLDGIKGWVA